MSYQTWRDKKLQSDPELLQEYKEAQREFAFRNALTRARIGANLTQQDIADRSGMNQSAIARLESGDVQPTVPTILRLANALNVCFELTPTGDVNVQKPETAHADG